MTEVQAMIASGGALIVVNVVGWAVNQVFIRRDRDRREVAAEATRLAEQSYLHDRIDNMPCQIDHNYMKNQGQLLQQVADIQQRVARMEAKANGQLR